jgi:hypothetical protein
VIGVLFMPLQLYVFWLLLKVFVSEEQLSRRSRNRAFVAVAISLPMTILLCLLLRKAFRNGQPSESVAVYFLTPFSARTLHRSSAGA